MKASPLFRHGEAARLCFVMRDQGSWGGERGGGPGWGLGLVGLDGGGAHEGFGDADDRLDLLRRVAEQGMGTRGTGLTEESRRAQAENAGLGSVSGPREVASRDDPG